MKDMIINEIKSFVRLSPFNKSQEKDYNYFDEPLIGFSSINDPLFSVYKEKIGEFHLLPVEWFESEFGPQSIKDGTVISWVLPINEIVLASNRAETAFPSREWAQTRFYGEKFNNLLAQHIIELLQKNGYRSIAPAISSRWQRMMSKNLGHASNWSERHAAYASGLGTFSLNDALITHRGIAHRCGSIITELVLEITERPYQGVADYCLYSTSKKCGACISRCPAGALSKDGHNKDLCFSHTRNKVIPTVNEGYGVTTPSCGLCQTRVPCEKCIPGRRS
jgi:epoxyqueuosine reductase